MLLVLDIAEEGIEEGIEVEALEVLLGRLEGGKDVEEDEEEEEEDHPLDSWNTVGKTRGPVRDAESVAAITSETSCRSRP